MSAIKEAQRKVADRQSGMPYLLDYTFEKTFTLRPAALAPRSVGVRAKLLMGKGSIRSRMQVPAGEPLWWGGRVWTRHGENNYRRCHLCQWGAK